MPKNSTDIETFMDGVRKRNPGQDEFVQAVRDVAQDIVPFVAEHVEYREAEILRRVAEPDRIVSFRVCWEDDEGNIRVERGWRVQNNNAIGPYKGGLRFSEDVTESVLKFLAFEQTFKNSLTGLPLGGGKGGSNFNPKGKSDREVMRFCQSFMSELYRHVGPDTDVPAGDIGVGAREIGYLFGQYKRLTGRWEGVLTGKATEFGGSKLRTEATGYGVVYFLREMLHARNEKLEGKSVVLSGSGNVSLHAAEKLLHCAAKVLTLSDRDGFIHAADGIDEEALERIKKLKMEKRGRLSEAAEQIDGIEFHKGKAPWNVECDIALPCATQNELDDDAAQALLDNGVLAVVEGANMPSTAKASERFRQSKILFGPAKAANAGGVAVSGLEMSQNSERVSWEHDRLDHMLTDLMKDIHAKCVECGQGSDGTLDYVRGANVAGFRKVADAMLAFGVV